ncbi:hypothetical protein G7Y89_g7237 [Cudoniella acicularis]|uniref:Uncharacterized protein n=1 Tax=Cudoniella acicularis TaxID=354080 RepID=A0A8H4RIY0_9HELO|nr:hypothetical protein G7Y89_g7237 [Cudoniella acicularis]
MISSSILDSRTRTTSPSDADIFPEKSTSGGADDLLLLRWHKLPTICILTTLNPKLQDPKTRPYRAAMYTSLSLSTLVFIVHGITIHGWEIQNHRMGLSRMGLMGLLNLISAGSYAARVSDEWNTLTDWCLYADSGKMVSQET